MMILGLALVAVGVWVAYRALREPDGWAYKQKTFLLSMIGSAAPMGIGIGMVSIALFAP